MKVVDISKKQTFHGTMLENVGDGFINIYNINRELVARVPSAASKLIFNESEIPYMEEMK